MSLKSKLLMLRRMAYTCLRTGRMVGGGLFSHAERRRLHDLSHFLGYTDGKPRLPVMSLEELTGGESPQIRMAYPSSGEWQVSTYELAVLGQLVAWRQPASLFEFGTFDGRSTLNMLANAPEGATITTIDLPDRQDLPEGKSSGALLAQAVAEGRVRRIAGDTLCHDFTEFKGTQDFVFVDAGHSYGCASSDSRNALAMTEGRPGAVILWHDYTTLIGVTRAVDELLDRQDIAGRFVRLRHTSMACLVRD